MGSGDFNDTIAEFRKLKEDMLNRNDLEDEEEAEEDEVETDEDEETEETEEKEDFISEFKLRKDALDDKYVIKELPGSNFGGINTPKADMLGNKKPTSERDRIIDIANSKLGSAFKSNTHDFKTDFEAEFEREWSQKQLAKQVMEAQESWDMEHTIQNDFTIPIDDPMVIKGTKFANQRKDFDDGNMTREESIGKMYDPIPSAKLLTQAGIKKELDSIIVMLYNMQTQFEIAGHDSQGGYMRIRRLNLEHFKNLRTKYNGIYKHKFMDKVLKSKGIRRDMNLMEKIRMDTMLIEKDRNLKKLENHLRKFEVLKVEQMKSKFTKDFGTGEFVDCSNEGFAEGLGWKTKDGLWRINTNK